MLSYFREDKKINHEVLGELTCSGLKELYEVCKVSVMQTHHDLCKEGLYLSTKCYFSKDKQVFVGYLNKKINQRVQLFRHLQQQGSIIPLLMQKSKYSNFLDALIESNKGSMVMQDSQYKRFLLKELQINNGIFTKK